MTKREGSDSTASNAFATAALSSRDVLITGIAFALYVATLTPHPAWDALRFATATATHAPERLSDAHHPLGGLLVYGISNALQALGWNPSALRLLQLASAAGAALALGVLHAVLRRAGASAVLAVGTCAALGASLAFWEIATDGEVYGVASATLMIAWWCLWRARDVTSAAWAGAAAGFALLGHQLNAVVMIGGLVWGGRTRASWPAAAAYGAGAAVPVVAGYLIAYSLSSYDDWFAWMIHYVGDDFRFPARGPLLGGALGLAESVVKLTAGWTAAAAAVVLFAILVIAVAAWRAASRGPDSSAAAAAAAATLVAGMAAAWWEPQTRKFWVPALVCGWLAVGLALARRPAARGQAVALCAAALALLNAATVILPRAEQSDPYLHAALQIGAATASSDLIIVGADRLGPRIEYDGARPYATNLFAVFLASSRRAGNVDLERLLADVQARRGRIFITSDAFAISARQRALAPDLPPDFEHLLPGAQRAPVLRFTVGGAPRVLYEVVLPSDARPTRSS